MVAAEGAVVGADLRDSGASGGGGDAGCGADGRVGDGDSDGEQGRRMHCEVGEDKEDMVRRAATARTRMSQSIAGRTRRSRR